MTSSERRMLEKAYAAFNARDIDSALDVMHAVVIVDVPGHDGVREYWTRQWGVIDPHVEPMRFEADADGRTVDHVHQVVRDPSGNVVADEMVQHVYSIQDGLVKSMEIREP